MILLHFKNLDKLKFNNIYIFKKFSSILTRVRSNHTKLSYFHLLYNLNILYCIFYINSTIFYQFTRNQKISQVLVFFRKFLYLKTLLTDTFICFFFPSSPVGKNPLVWRKIFITNEIDDTRTVRHVSSKLSNLSSPAKSSKGWKNLHQIGKKYPSCWSLNFLEDITSRPATYGHFTYTKELNAVTLSLHALYV